MTDPAPLVAGRPTTEVLLSDKILPKAYWWVDTWPGNKAKVFTPRMIMLLCNHFAESVEHIGYAETRASNSIEFLTLDQLSSNASAEPGGTPAPVSGTFAGHTRDYWLGYAELGWMPEPNPVRTVDDDWFSGVPKDRKHIFVAPFVLRCLADTNMCTGHTNWSSLAIGNVFKLANAYQNFRQIVPPDSEPGQVYTIALEDATYQDLRQAIM
ncbi:unnamed protein product, partial [Amoebophrya sp. A25]|eukprot:GSA25T00015971001.1